MTLQSWLKETIFWIKRLFKSPQQYQKPKVLSSEYNLKRTGVLLELERNSVSAVGSFQVCHTESLLNFLILVDNLHKIRRYNKTKSASATDSLESLLARNIGASEKLSHRITIAWVKPGSFKFLKIVGIWDANFTDSRFVEYSFGEDKIAYEIARSAAREITTLAPIVGELWQERIDRYNWEEWFVHRSRSFLGKNHNLSIRKILFK